MHNFGQYWTVNTFYSVENALSFFTTRKDNALFKNENVLAKNDLIFNENLWENKHI
jgi:hypothetical protein